MKLYQVHIRNAEGRSQEYRFFLNKKEARRYLKANTAKDWYLDAEELFPVDVEISKNGILSALNTHASHPDNGQ